MDKKNGKNKFKALIILSLLLIGIACKDKNQTEIVYLKDREGMFKKWDELFPSHEIINSEFPPSHFFLALSSKGNFFLYNRKEEKIVLFDFRWNYVKEIAKKGEGPGEFQIPFPVWLDRKDNLYVNDIGKRVISLYSSPDYKFSGQFRVKSHISKAFIDPDGHFITFSLYNTPFLIKKYDRNGKILKETFKCKDEILRIFMARFNPGGMANLEDKGFLFVYPDRYEIYFYDYALNLQKIYKVKSFSKFYPVSPDFPQELSPYEISSEHSKWWDQFLHPCDIYILKGKFFMVSLLKSEGIGGTYYINFHDLKGKTYARGLEVPFKGKILWVMDDFIYVLEEERFGEGDNIVPAKLHRYQLKKDL
jgi:hypothetical protein